MEVLALDRGGNLMSKLEELKAALDAAAEVSYDAFVVVADDASDAACVLQRDAEADYDAASDAYKALKKSEEAI